MFRHKLMRGKSRTCLFTVPMTILLICGPVIGSFFVSTNGTYAASNEDQWNPPSNLTVALDQVWQRDERTRPTLYSFMNYGWDQIMANKGSINYCVRWDSNAPVSATLRDQIDDALPRQFNKWIQQMVENGKGWDGWPYTNVPVRVVGWAARNRSLLQWTDNSVDIYVNDIREDAPQCAEACGRFFRIEPDRSFYEDYNYSKCPGGPLHHYDMSLWLTAGLGGGAGGDWGLRIGSEYLVDAVNAHTDNIHILEHEMGHAFGLDDFYDWQPPGIKSFIMMAGSAFEITPFDKWMLRNVWHHIKNRYQSSATIPTNQTRRLAGLKAG